MSFLKLFWSNLLTFIIAVADAFANFMQGRWRPRRSGTPAFVIRRTGLVESHYYKEDEAFPSFDITRQLELLMADLRKIPKPLERFGVDKKTRKLQAKVYLEPDESTIASMLYMNHAMKRSNYQEFKKELGSNVATATERQKIQLQPAIAKIFDEMQKKKRTS